MRIGIIGAGKVGTTVAYSLILSGIATELALVDVARDRLEGECLDLSSMNANTHILYTQDLEDIADYDVVVISAGYKRAPGESRLDLVYKNAAIVRNIAIRLSRLRIKDIIVIVITNPVEIMTYTMFKYSNIPKNKIFGLGTYVDTLRLKYLISHKLGIPKNNVEVLVIGEHGDNMVILWSCLKIINKEESLDDLKLLDPDELNHQLIMYGADLNKKKDGANWCVGSATLDLLKAIKEDTKEVFPLSWLFYELDKSREVVASVPVVLGKEGVVSVELQLDTLGKKEKENFITTLSILASYQEEV